MRNIDSLLSKEEMSYKAAELNDIARNMQPLDVKEFTRFRGRYVYSEPLRNKDEEAVTGLNFPQQLYVLERFGEQEGLKLRHGHLTENVAASRSRETAEYARGVLRRYSIYTREIIRIKNYLTEVGKVKLVSRPPYYRLTQQGQPNDGCDRHVDRMLGNRAEKFITPEFRRYVFDWIWGGVCSSDEKGFSALWHSWNKNECFGVFADSPSTTGPSFAISVWTDQNPRR